MHLRGRAVGRSVITPARRHSMIWGRVFCLNSHPDSWGFRYGSMPPRWAYWLVNRDRKTLRARPKAGIPYLRLLESLYIYIGLYGCFATISSQRYDSFLFFPALFLCMHEEHVAWFSAAISIKLRRVRLKPVGLISSIAAVGQVVLTFFRLQFHLAIQDRW